MSQMKNTSSRRRKLLNEETKVLEEGEAIKTTDDPKKDRVTRETHVTDVLDGVAEKTFEAV